MMSGSRSGTLNLVVQASRPLRVDAGQASRPHHKQDVAGVSHSPRLLMLMLLMIGLLAASPAVQAQQPPAREAPKVDRGRDNDPAKVRQVPPPGIEVPADRKKALEEKVIALGDAITRLAALHQPRIDGLLPDIRIYHKAVRDALTYNEFFNLKDLDKADNLLEEGRLLAGQLEQGRAPWTTVDGLVTRGYVSRIDGSVQPYGLVIPESYAPKGKEKYRLDIWFHGRGETMSEVNFLADRRRNPGTFTPRDTIVLHPYGRHNNAFKFAGEVDVLEALESVKSRYRIDDDRISVRGFSMGGAGAWQFAVHYADQWFAANPGAGFSETPRFLEFFQKETLKPTWYERKLWHLYDCTDYAGNLHQCPTVAYSGEKDIQKQAADVMAEALRDRGIELVHVIGPSTGHSYHPSARAEVERRLESLALGGRLRAPRRVELETYTLKYNRMHWVTIDGLLEHWAKAKVVAALGNDGRPDLETENISALSLDFPAGLSPFIPNEPVWVSIDGQRLQGPAANFSDKSWSCHMERVKGTWRLAGSLSDGLRKLHDLQGPIDDAFMDTFVFVLPTGKGRHDAVNAWVDSESRRAIGRWRSQFRGDARVKKDTEITEADIASSNLILWGDPESNAVLAKVAPKLPITWEKERIEVGDRHFDAKDHTPILIYPNPLNPTRYVVLNSGFTFREFADLNNARQVPVLPDWAIVDLKTASGSLLPGKIAAADFFGESWELRPPHGE